MIIKLTQWEVKEGEEIINLHKVNLKISRNSELIRVIGLKS